MTPEQSNDLTNLQRLLRRFRGAKRWLFVRRWLGLGILGYLLAVLVAVHLDRFLHFETGGRWICFLLVHGLVGVGAVGFVAGLVLAYRRTATLIREMEPLMEGTEESLVTAHDLRGTAASFSEEEHAMFALLTSRAESAASVERAPAPSDPNRRWRIAGLIACMLIYGALLAIPIYEFPLMLRRFYRPSANLPRPSFTKIALGEYPAKVGMGEDLTIPVRISGRMVEKARIELRREDEPPQLLPMTRIGRDRFVHTLFALRQDISFRVQAGDGATALHHVRAVRQPSTDRLRVRIRPPDYTGLEARTVENERRIGVIEGSDVKLEIHCRQPLRSARLEHTTTDGELEKIALDFADGRATHARENVREQTSLRPVLVNEEGFQNLDQEPIVITPEPDEPPTIALPKAPSVVEMYPTESRRFDVEAGDDLGLTELTLASRVNPTGDDLSAPSRRPIERYDPPVREAETEFSLDLEGLGVQAGDVVEFTVEATDIRRQVAASRAVRVRVIAYEPGLEERRRIAHLRYLRRVLTAAGGNASDADNKSGAPLSRRQVSSLENYAETLGVEVPDLGRTDQPGERMVDHILREQGLTPFHVYRRDLRQIATVLAARQIFPSPGESDRTTARRLAESVLPGLIHYRAHRCLHGSLHSFAAELERIAGSTDQGRQEKRLEQLIDSLEGWAVFLARTSRESPFDVASFERFSADVEAINTLLYRSRGGSPERLRELSGRLRACAERSDGIEGELHEKLTAARRALRDMFAEAVRQERAATVLLDSADRDPAVSAVEKLLLSLRGTESPLRETTYFRAQAALTRVVDFREHRRSVRNDPLLPDPVARREAELLSRQHAALLSERGWPSGDPRDLIARSLSSPAEARTAAREHPALRTGSRRAALRELLDSYAALRTQHAEFTERVSRFVPENTRQGRKELLTRATAFEKQVERSMRRIRLWLINLPLAEGAVRENTARGWGRVLVRLQDRLDFFRTSARRTLDHLRGRADERLSREELSLLPARMTALGGAIRGLESFFDALKPVLERSGELPEGFFARQAERLSAARRLDANLERYFALRTAGSPADRAEVARSILAEDAVLRGRILARMLRPRIRAIGAAARDLWRAMDDEDAAPEAVLAAGRGLLEAAQAARADLRRIGSGEVARHVETIDTPLTEILGMLHRAGDGRPAKRRVQLLDYNRQRLRSLIETLRGQVEELETGARALTAAAGRTYAERAARATRERLVERSADFQRLALTEALEPKKGSEPVSRPDRLPSHAWFASINYAASSTLLREGVTLLVGAGGRRVESKKHWLVREFRESLKQPLPMRHRGQVKEYFRNLRSGFREHAHTR